METAQYRSDFLAFRDELSSFVLRMVTNRQDTEDIVQDTYIRAFDKLDSFQQRSSFKTWVFAIALNISRDHLSKQKRWLEHAQDHGANLHLHEPERMEAFLEVFNSTPERDYEIREHITYCFNCINKTLELDQQICLLLKDVYDFKVHEIMEMTELTEGKVKHAIANARKHMIRVFDNRCAFVSKKGTCDQCTTLKGVLNPKQDAHIKAREIKLVRNGDNPNKEYLLDLRLALVKQIDPLNSSNSLMNTYMLESCESWVEADQKRISEKSH